MLTFLSTFISFLSGGLPRILEFFQDRADKKHELAMADAQLKAQLELQKAGFTQQKELELIRFDEVELQSSSADLQARMSHDIELGRGASRWVINTRSLVRPLITYGFFALYVFVECFGFYYATHTGVSFDAAMTQLWDDDTKTIFSAIIAFWFGTQAFKK